MENGNNKESTTDNYKHVAATSDNEATYTEDMTDIGPIRTVSDVLDDVDIVNGVDAIVQRSESKPSTPGLDKKISTAL